MNHIHWSIVLAMAWACVPDAFPQIQLQTTWQVDSLSSLGGHGVTVIGDPEILETPFGLGMLFDGNDGVIVDDHPIAGAGSFTLEMIFRPDPIVLRSSFEPRVFHVQSSGNEHRAILEIRVSRGNWFPDGFLQSASIADPSQNVGLTLIDSEILNPLGEWYHYAMVYDGSEMRVYIDGRFMLSGAIAVQPLSPGQVSLGMRHSRERFFEGAIARVRFTRSALDPSDFMTLSSTKLEITNIQLDPDGTLVRLTWSATPERAYTIERSTDLKTWNRVGEWVAEDDPTGTYSEARVPSETTGFFYRIREE